MEGSTETGQRESTRQQNSVHRVPILGVTSWIHISTKWSVPSSGIVLITAITTRFLVWEIMQIFFSLILFYFLLIQWLSFTTVERLAIPITLASLTAVEFY